MTPITDNDMTIGNTLIAFIYAVVFSVINGAHTIEVAFNALIATTVGFLATKLFNRLYIYATKDKPKH